MLNKKEIERRKEQLRNRIHSEVSAFPNNSIDKAQRLKAVRGDKEVLKHFGYASAFDFFCHTYLPHLFSIETGAHQHELDKKIIDVNLPLVVTVEPKEHGKTTRYGEAYPLFCALLKSFHFILIGGRSIQDAAEISADIQTELEENPRIKNDFGEMKSNNWSEEEFILRNNVKITCISMKVSPIGWKFGRYRPQLIIINDPSKLDDTYNEEMEKKKKDKILQEYLPSGGSKRIGNETTFDVKLIILANWLRNTSCVAQLIDHLEENKPRFAFWRVLPAVLDWEKGLVLWEQKFTIQYFKELRSLIGHIAFEISYQNRDVATGEYYSQEDFKKINMNEAVKLWETMDKCIQYIDPSGGESIYSDLKATGVFGYKKEMGYFLFDALSVQGSPMRFWDGVIDMNIRWGYPLIVLEGNFNQKRYSKQELEEAAIRRGVAIKLKLYYTRKAKSARIEHPANYVGLGKCYINWDISECRDVVNDLCLYPKIPKKDRCDLFGTAIEILEGDTRKIKAKIWRI